MTKPRHIRIIGGQWKSRRVRIAAVAGLRPSPDAVRETLFNWLPDLRGMACLDLFAGSGAFGFEAASRGAARVVMVECEPATVDMLRANRDALCGDDGGAVEIFSGTVAAFLRQFDGGDGFDMVFMDPPFAADLLAPACENLRRPGVLNPAALVYIESPPTADPLPIPPNWHIIRQKTGSGVRATLIQT